MTEEDKKLLTTFEARLRHFMFLYEELGKENAHLKTLLSEKEAQLDEAARRYQDLEALYADLKMARIIGVTDQDLNDTKQRLAKLVREVDKCIALLNE